MGFTSPFARDGSTKLSLSAFSPQNHLIHRVLFAKRIYQVPTLDVWNPRRDFTILFLLPPRVSFGQLLEYPSFSAADHPEFRHEICKQVPSRS